MHYVFKADSINKMKYCPFCGSEMISVYDGDYMGQVECLGCDECEEELEFFILEEVLSRYPDWIKIERDEEIQRLQQENRELHKKLSMLCPVADLSVIDTLLTEKQAYMEHISKLNDLLKRLYESAIKLDAEYCTYLNRGEHSLSASEYEEIADVFIEVEDYLKEIE